LLLSVLLLFILIDTSYHQKKNFPDTPFTVLFFALIKAITNTISSIKPMLLLSHKFYGNRLSFSLFQKTYQVLLNSCSIKFMHKRSD
jgi:hypothetical protein